MLSRLKETDDDHPYPHGDYLYYTRTVKGLSYKIHCRKPTTGPGAREQVVLDENALAVGHEYSAVSCHEPSPDHTLLAYAVDHNGYETYSLQIKDIATGRVLTDVLEETSGDAVWGADSSTLFYLKMDPEHRPDRCYMHVLGTPQVEHFLALSPWRSPPGSLPPFTHSLLAHASNPDHPPVGRRVGLVRARQSVLDGPGSHRQRPLPHGRRGEQGDERALLGGLARGRGGRGARGGGAAEGPHPSPSPRFVNASPRRLSLAHSSLHLF